MRVIDLRTNSQAKRALCATRPYFIVFFDANE